MDHYWPAVWCVCLLRYEWSRRRICFYRSTSMQSSSGCLNNQVLVGPQRYEWPNGPEPVWECFGTVDKSITLLDHYCVVSTSYTYYTHIYGLQVKRLRFVMPVRQGKKMVEHLCNIQSIWLCVRPSHSNTHTFVHLKGAVAFNAGISHCSIAFPLLIQWTNESFGKGTEQPHTQHPTLACAFKHSPFFLMWIKTCPCPLPSLQCGTTALVRTSITAPECWVWHCWHSLPD